MTCSPAGCGVLAHAPECLCDVVLADPVPIKSDLSFSDYHLGHEMLWYLAKPEVLDSEDILDVLDHLARAHEAIDALGIDEVWDLAYAMPEKPHEIGGEVTRTVSSKGSVAFVRKHAHSPISNGELRAETNRIFGTHISPSHMTHMRKRYGGTTL